MTKVTAAPATDAKRIQPRVRKDSTPMDHWKLLEIEPTDDSRLIKEGYVSKLREFHPEDDPEGFMRLQEAYRWALGQAKQPEELLESCQQVEPVELSSPHPSRLPEQQEAVAVAPAARFMALLATLCANKQQCQDPAAWRKLLQGDVQWPLEIAPILQERVMTLLKTNAPLPYEAWYGCNTLLGWAEPDNLTDLFTDDELIRLFGNCGDVRISLRVCEALCDQGKEYAADGDERQAIACYENILAWFAASNFPEVRQNAARTAGELLLWLERSEESSLAVRQAKATLLRLFQTGDGQQLKLAVAEVWMEEAMDLWDADTAAEEVLPLCDKVVALFDESEIPAILAKALYYQGFCWAVLGDNGQAIVIYDKVIRLFADCTDEMAREYVADALFEKACRMEEGVDLETVIGIYNQVINQFINSDNEAIRVDVAMALRNKIHCYTRLGRRKEKFAIYDQAFNLFLNSENEEIQIQVAVMLCNKGRTYLDMGRTQDALAVYNQLLDKFADSDNEEIGVQVVRASTDKACCYFELELIEEMFALYDQTFQRFVNSENEDIQYQVAVLLYNQGTDYFRLEKYQAAIVLYDQMLSLVADKEDEATCVLVARALRNKALCCDAMGLTKEAFASQAQAIQRFFNSANEDVEVQIAAMMYNHAYDYAEMKQPQEALATYDQLIHRFTGRMHREIQEAVAKAKINKEIIERGGATWWDTVRIIWYNGVELLRQWDFFREE